MENKILHLNYTQQKGEKVITKNFAFHVNSELSNDVIKEVGEELAKLFNIEFDNSSLTFKVIL